MCSGRSFLLCAEAGAVQLKGAVAITARNSARRAILIFTMEVGSPRPLVSNSHSRALAGLSTTFLLVRIAPMGYGKLERERAKGKNMEEIRIVDTTLRDGNTSLWAHNMTTGMMHPVLRHMDQAGFEAMEFFVSGRFKKVVREQRDNPWDWVRYGQKEIKNTQLRYHGGMNSGFTLTPRCIPRLIIERVVHYGIKVTRLSDPWNDYSALAKEVAELKSLGMDSVVNIIYSISPRHTDEYYARKTREAAALKPYRLCYKDVGGMLTPERARALARIILDNAGGVPVEFHAHCNNGLAPFNILEVVKQGIRIVHTSIPPLANGSAQPSIFNVANNLRALGYKPMVNEKVLEPVER